MTKDLAPSSLHQKLAAIQGELTTVAKDGGFNSNQNYSFVNEESFLKRLKPLTSSANLTLVVSFDLTSYREVEGNNGRLTFIAVGTSTLTITDGDTGESIQVTAAGVAHDTGDKAVYKAQTGGAKYAYWKAFALATGDDPEKSSSSDDGVTRTSKGSAPRAVSNGGLF